MKLRRSHLFALATSSLLSFSAAAWAADATGNWIWTTPGRNGGPARVSVLSLKVEGSQLTGKLSTPGSDGKPASTPITDGKASGETISFSLVRENNGDFITNSYSGKVGADSITGTIAFSRNGEPATRDWEAKPAGTQTEAPAIYIKPGYDEFGRKIVNETKYKEISVADAEKFLADHPETIILDLRTPREFSKGHLPNAKNYDTTDEAKYKEVLSTLDKTKWYLVHSAVGHYRTVRALEYFEANGFEHAAAIDGGYKAWAAAGKPVEK
jgi:rhodanese-related sulfurtransferase